MQSYNGFIRMAIWTSTCSCFFLFFFFFFFNLFLFFLQFYPKHAGLVPSLHLSKYGVFDLIIIKLKDSGITRFGSLIQFHAIKSARFFLSFFFTSSLFTFSLKTNCFPQQTALQWFVNAVSSEYFVVYTHVQMRFAVPDLHLHEVRILISYSCK